MLSNRKRQVCHLTALPFPGFIHYFMCSTWSLSSSGFIYYFMCMTVLFVHMCDCGPCVCSCPRSGVDTGSPRTGVMGGAVKPGPSARAASACNCWAVSPARSLLSAKGSMAVRGRATELPLGPGRLPSADTTDVHHHTRSKFDIF